MSKLAPVWRLLALLTVALLACVTEAGARPLAQYQHRLFSSVDGAPEQVRTLAQDRDGMLWVGAATGIYTFDGQRFTRVQIDFRDSPRQPYYLHADPAGGIWIGWMRGGVTLLRDGTAQHFDGADGTPGGTVWSFAFDQEGGLWASGVEGVSRFDGRHWHRMGPQDGYDAEHPSTVNVDRDGNVGVFTEKGVYLMRKGSHHFDAPIGKTETRQVLAIGPQGQMYFMAASGIRRIASMQRYEAPDFAMLYRETRRLSGSFLADRDGGLWFDGPTGLHHLAQPDAPGVVEGTLRPDTETFTHAAGFSASGADCMLEDRQGDIWVATDAGIDRFRPSDLVNVSLQSGATVSLPSVLAAGSAGGIWMHTFNPRNTWSRIDAAGKTVARYEGEFASPVALAGDALLAVKDKTQVMRLDEGVAQPYGAPLPSGRVSAMARDSGGNVWLGTANGTVLRGNGGAWETVQGLPPGRVSMISAEPDGVVWIGYLDNQLVRIVGAHVLRYAGAQGLTAGAPSAVVTRGATHWVAGARGLNVIEGGKIHAVTSAPGMFDDLADLQLDRRGGLWLTGRAGVMYLSSAQLDHCLRGCAGTMPALYDNADGLRSRSLALSQSQLAQDAQDRIWIATGTAVFRIDGTPGGAVVAAPRALVLGATARGERYAGTRPVVLAAGTQDLQFDYTAPVLDTPERVRFRYRLAGYDKGWQHADGRREAFYTGLGPGNYQFEVAAAQGNSGWSAVPASLAVEIAPGWFQSWWFRTLSALVLLAALTLFYRLRVHRLTQRVREQAETRQRERERIARDLHDTVLQTNFALLLQVRAVAATAADHALGLELDTIVSRARAALAEGRDKVAGLRAQQVAAPTFTIALEQLARSILHDSGVVWHCRSHGRPWPLDEEVTREAQAIVAEALVNVRKHAQAMHASIDVRYGWRTCTVVVSDDGRGIAEDFLAGRAGHWGLAGMRERAALIAARLDVESGIGGTTLRLRLPRRQPGPM